MYIFRLREQINKLTNKQKVQVCSIFSYISEPLNLSDFMVDLINFNVLQFCWNLNLLLPQGSSSTISLSDWFKIFSSTNCSSLKRVFLMSVKQWQCRKKWETDSTYKLQEHKGFTRSLKLWLNLCSFMWLSQSLNLVSTFKPLGSSIL